MPARSLLEYACERLYFLQELTVSECGSFVGGCQKRIEKSIRFVTSPHLEYFEDCSGFVQPAKPHIDTSVVALNIVSAQIKLL